MRNRLAPLVPVIAAVALSAMTGCSGTYRHFTRPAAAGTSVLPEGASNTCDVYFQLETWDGLVHSDWSCIKPTGSPLDLPTNVYLYTKADTKADFRKYCTDGSVKVVKTPKRPTTTAAQSGADNNVTCLWNREFRDNFPLNFRFSTSIPKDGHIEVESAAYKPVSTPQPLSKFIALIRVLRNGSGVFAWEGTEGRKETSVSVMGDVLTTRALFEAPVPLSLYVLPTGFDRGQVAKVEAEKAIQSDWRTNLTTGLSAIVSANVPPELEEAYQCFRSQVEYLSLLGNDAAKIPVRKRIEQLDKRIKQHAEQAKSPWKATARVPSGAARPKKRSDGSPLKDKDLLLVEHPEGRFSFERYALDTKGWTKNAKPEDPKSPVVVQFEETRLYFSSLEGDGPFEGVPEYGSLAGCVVPQPTLDVLKRAISEQDGAKLDSVAARIQEYRGALESVLAAMPAEQAKRTRESLFWVQNVERLTLATMDAIERAHDALPTIAKAARSATTDPETFKRSYLAFARSLPQFDDALLKPVPNPAPGPDERNLDMTFRNPAQAYWLLVWSGLPFGVFKASGVQTELRAENAIPFVDIHGGSYQAGSFIGHASFGTGIFGAKETIERADGTTYETAFNLGVQLNASIRGFRIGAGYLIREPDRDNYKNNVRLLFGADLLRLFTGKDSAVVTDNGEVQAGSE
ncbi:MAG: hypothetical protein AB7S68_34705 [Polyangiaceae bacterium]